MHGMTMAMMASWPRIKTQSQLVLYVAACARTRLGCGVCNACLHFYIHRPAKIPLCTAHPQRARTGQETEVGQQRWWPF